MDQAPSPRRLRPSARPPACRSQMWRVYQRGIERWLADLLQSLFDLLTSEGVVPAFVQARHAGPLCGRPLPWARAGILRSSLPCPAGTKTHTMHA